MLLLPGTVNPSDFGEQKAKAENLIESRYYIYAGVALAAIATFAAMHVTLAQLAALGIFREVIELTFIFAFSGSALLTGYGLFKFIDNALQLDLN